MTLARFADCRSSRLGCEGQLGARTRATKEASLAGQPSESANRR